METKAGVIIQTRSFGERLSDITVRGVLQFEHETTNQEIVRTAEQFLLENTFIGSFARDNNQKVAFKWHGVNPPLMHVTGRIWLFDEGFDETEFNDTRDYAKEILFAPAFYVYLPNIQVATVSQEGAEHDQ